ncbi:MAG: hypothetical protein COA99_15130 [Moraxellaceae bacterium]|nr:MAG: hypothetical protein COA99_15130 [Moraxellaceae bacterium]
MRATIDLIVPSQNIAIVHLCSGINKAQRKTLFIAGCCDKKGSIKGFNDKDITQQDAGIGPRIRFYRTYFKDKEYRQGGSIKTKDL